MLFQKIKKNYTHVLIKDLVVRISFPGRFEIGLFIFSPFFYNHYLLWKSSVNKREGERFPLYFNSSFSVRPLWGLLEEEERDQHVFVLTGRKSRVSRVCECRVLSGP